MPISDFLPEPIELSDVILIDQQGVEYHVHSIFLAHKSPIFRHLVWKKPVETIHTSFDSETTLQLLRYVYENEIPRQHIVNTLSFFKMWIFYQFDLDVLRLHFHPAGMVYSEFIALMRMRIPEIIRWVDSHYSHMSTGPLPASCLEICEIHDPQRTWYLGYILQRSEDKVRVHYFGWNTGHDEWIESNSERIDKTCRRIPRVERHGLTGIELEDNIKPSL